MCENNKKSWWEALGATAAVIAALASVGSVYYAYQTVKEANEDAEQTRLQQTTRFQGIVMSTCIQEYFQIRRETVGDLRQFTDPTEKQKVEDLYSERMYGLHFEEYNLFRQGMIPQHIYALWLESLKSKIYQSEKYYPQIQKDKFIQDTQYTNDDFSFFVSEILGATNDTQIGDIVEKEAQRPRYQ
jgi:hypothetical protein